MMRVLRWLLLLVLVLVVGFVVWALFINPAPTVQKAPPPAARPTRPLQADAEGYYEPGYNFTVSGLRFTRLTLRPEAFVTFARAGTTQEVGCLEAVIRPETVFLRCDIDRVGTITIDGRFLSRFATTRLDTPVLSAVMTVRNLRGETVYQARDSFGWHPPE